MPGPIYVLTGATSGFGLAVARQLAERDDALLICGVRDPDVAKALRRAVPAVQLRLAPLDLTRLASVGRFADAVTAVLGETGTLAGVLCIAGIQIVTGQRLTEDGVDESFAVNYLGHFALVRALTDRLAAGAAVITIGSSTTVPGDALAKRFGFRGPDFADAASVALGKSSQPGDAEQHGRDRYAAGKLCNILYAWDMASRLSEEQVRFFCFDPGLMPGTDLAREASGLARFVWSYLMPSLALFVPGVSTPNRSARALVDSLVLDTTAYPSGSYMAFTGKPAPHPPEARDPALGAALYKESLRLVERIAV